MPESKVLEAFWSSLITIPETKIKPQPDHFPGTTIFAYFPRKNYMTESWCKEDEFLRIEFSRWNNHVSVECDFGESYSTYRWCVENEISSFTVYSKEIDRDSWLDEFAERFKKVRFG